MIKSTIKNNTEEEEEIPEYPKLMIHKDGDFIVMFEGIVNGHVLYSTVEDYKVGYYSPTWNQGEFKPFNGTLTLSNHE